LKIFHICNIPNSNFQCIACIQKLLKEAHIKF